MGEHQLATGLQILFDRIFVVAHSRYYVESKIRDTIQETKHPNKINPETSYPLSSTWNTVLIGPSANQSVVTCLIYHTQLVIVLANHRQETLVKELRFCLVAVFTPLKTLAFFLHFISHQTHTHLIVYYY